MRQKLKVTLGSDQILGVDEAQRGRLSNLRPPAPTVWEDQRWRPRRNGRPGAQIGGPGVVSQISEMSEEPGTQSLRINQDVLTEFQ